MSEHADIEARYEARIHARLVQFYKAHGIIPPRPIMHKAFGPKMGDILADAMEDVAHKIDNSPSVIARGIRERSGSTPARVPPTESQIEADMREIADKATPQDADPESLAIRIAQHNR
ncbi:hypothetical protein ACFY0A_17765 [Streptomyces sp. NPDC001698]|uniref:hypothetical protein n=1 Tax=Streptomyces sp. NPDC001698 TaxID=3364601 RepID=UPI0036ADFAC8